MADEQKKTSELPCVVVFAGPNGSGKTSLIDELRECGLQTSAGTIPVPARFINPDQVAKDLPDIYPDQVSRDIAAARAAVRLRAEAASSKESFAFETVMSHPARINEILMLKELGYRVFLTFITTDDPERNVARVTLRYETGTTTGHYVAPDKVRERYERTLNLLPRAAEEADAAFVYDNSTEFKKATLQAVIEKDDVFQLSPHVMSWVIERLAHPLQRREEELNQLVASARRHGHELGDVDELMGAYSGPIILKTTNFIMQFDESSGKPVIHDRLMLETTDGPPARTTPPHILMRPMSIKYSMQHAPAVNPISRIDETADATRSKLAALAHAFMSQSPIDAVKIFPELAGAYAALTIRAELEQANMASSGIASDFEDRIRDAIALELAEGKAPEVNH